MTKSIKINFNYTFFDFHNYFICLNYTILTHLRLLVHNMKNIIWQQTTVNH